MTRKIYKIISAISEMSLAMEVNDHLQLGWNCQGGVHVNKATEFIYETYFYQAMILEIPDDN